MFKIITVAALGYIFYRLVASPRAIEQADEPDAIAQEPDEFVDYEEIE